MRLSTMRFQKWISDNNIKIAVLEDDCCEYDAKSFVFMLAPNTIYMHGESNDCKISCIKYFEVEEYQGTEYRYVTTIHTHGYYIEEPDKEYVMYLR